MNTISLIMHRPRQGLYKRVVLRSLARMSKGKLDILLPDGNAFSIGDGKGIRARMRIKDNDFFRRCALYGEVGFGEAYVDGLWDTGDISTVISWALLNIDNMPRLLPKNCPLSSILRRWRRRAEQQHPGNEFFRLFLDPSMTYSGAYFERDGMDLEEAQRAKYRRICEQLRLHPTDHVLEIGCGWGGAAIYMAKHYGCQVTSLTLSEQQFKFAAQLVKKEGLDHLITIRLEDYRNLTGRRFDKIVSVEMLEAVSHRHLKTYFQKCHDLLKQDGILALQAITCPDSRYNRIRKQTGWVRKHISTRTLLPSVGAINTAINHTGDMTLVDAKELGMHYAATFKVWFMQFNSRLAEVRALGFDERFIRKWNYYLCYCEAAFRMRSIYVMQLVYTRPNNTAH